MKFVFLFNLLLYFLGANWLPAQNAGAAAANPPYSKVPKSDCISVGEKTHLFPLMALVGKNPRIPVRDTFWLYNTCADTLQIAQLESATQEYFSLPPVLLPQQRTPLIFDGYLPQHSYAFDIVRFFCTLKLKDGSAIGLGINIPTVGNHPTVYYHADSSIQYALINPGNARFSTAVFTNPDGTLQAFGWIQDNDTSLKVGNWLHFRLNDPTFHSEDHIYSKWVSLSAFGDTENEAHTGFKVKVREKGIWKAPVADTFQHTIRFFISPQTDSILAYTDTTRYRFAVHYPSRPTYTHKQFYLRKPHERYITIGEYEMPFETDPNRYVILVKNRQRGPGPATGYHFSDSLIAVFQNQFPKIVTAGIRGNHWRISFEKMDSDERGKVIQHFEKDPNIAFVCQRYRLNRVGEWKYSSNRVKIALNVEDAEKWDGKSLDPAFSRMELDNGNHYHWMTYKGKMLDDRFFEAFRKLARNKRVIATYLDPVEEDE